MYKVTPTLTANEIIGRMDDEKGRAVIDRIELEFNGNKTPLAILAILGLGGIEEYIMKNPPKRNMGRIKNVRKNSPKH